MYYPPLAAQNAHDEADDAASDKEDEQRHKDDGIAGHEGQQVTHPANSGRQHGTEISEKSRQKIYLQFLFFYFRVTARTIT